jgi:hypothetical protein
MTSTKHQINSNHQNSKFQTESFGSFEIEAWDLFGIWDLEFGISGAS